MQKRVFMLVSYLVDDNDDAVSAPVPLCGTSSQKVAEKVSEVFLKYRSAQTPCWMDELERVLPRNLPDQIEKTLEQEEKSEVDDIFSKVKLPNT